MENKEQNLEERLSALIGKAKEKWGRFADGGRVNDCIQHSNSYTEVYYGPENKELTFRGAAPRVNRGNYIVFNDYYHLKTMRVYSPKLKYQHTYKRSEYQGEIRQCVDEDGYYRPMY